MVRNECESAYHIAHMNCCSTPDATVWLSLHAKCLFAPPIVSLFEVLLRITPDKSINQSERWETGKNPYVLTRSNVRADPLGVRRWICVTLFFSIPFRHFARTEKKPNESRNNRDEKRLHHGTRSFAHSLPRRALNKTHSSDFSLLTSNGTFLCRTKQYALLCYNMV